MPTRSSWRAGSRRRSSLPTRGLTIFESQPTVPRPIRRLSAPPAPPPAPSAPPRSPPSSVQIRPIGGERPHLASSPRHSHDEVPSAGLGRDLLRVGHLRRSASELERSVGDLIQRLDHRRRQAPQLRPQIPRSLVPLPAATRRATPPPPIETCAVKAITPDAVRGSRQRSPASIGAALTQRGLSAGV